MKTQLVEQFKNYFCEAAQSCFLTQLGIPVQVQRAEKSSLRGDLISSIGFSATQITGNASLIFPSAVYLEIVNNLLGESESSITPNNSDAGAEFLNIMYGLARPRMNTLGFDFPPAIPSVIYGSGLSVCEPKLGESFIFSVNSPAGIFFLSGTFLASDKKILS